MDSYEPELGTDPSQVNEETKLIPAEVGEQPEQFQEAREPEEDPTLQEFQKQEERITRQDNEPQEAKAVIEPPEPKEIDEAEEPLEPKGRSKSFLEKSKRCIRSNWCPFGLTLILVLSITSFFITHYVILASLQRRIKEGVILQNSSDAWAHPACKTVVRCYFFNITNAEDVQGNNDTVRVKQIGPYVYRVLLDRADLVWNDNDTVSYRMNHTFIFDAENSAGSEDDLVTTVSLPTVIIDSYIGGSFGSILKPLLKLKVETYQTYKVGELMWGYESEDLMKLERIVKTLNIFKTIIPDVPTELGYFYKVNGTPGPVFNVYTGMKDFKNFNKIFSWDNQRKLPYWSSDLANTVRGTDGSMLQPFIDSSSELSIFDPPFYRAFDLKFQQKCKTLGIGCLRFIIPDSAFSNTTMPSNITVDELSNEQNDEDFDFPDLYDQEEDFDDQSDMFGDSDDTQLKLHDARNDQNSTKIRQTSETKVVHKPFLVPIKPKKGGFCSPKCMPNGMYSLESVFKGTPLYVSLPHLLGADAVYTQNVNGFQPDESQHRPHFDVDDVTGVVVNQRRKFQLNVKIPAGEEEHHGPIVPLFWTDTESTVSESLVSQIRTAHLAYKAIGALRFFILAIAVLAWIFIVVVLFVRSCRPCECEHYERLPA